jgi:hypothetical protein
VLDNEAGDGKTLRHDLLKKFAADKAIEGLDYTAIKARWLSKSDPAKKLGSLVIWLKSKVSAETLLEKGKALFGATGAFCST